MGRGKVASVSWTRPRAAQLGREIVEHCESQGSRNRVCDMGGLAVPLVFASYVALSYRLALREGKLPFLPPNEWRWDSAYFTLLASGVVAIILIPVSRLWVRVFLAILYAAAMGLVLLFVNLNLSCAHGDCL